MAKRRKDLGLQEEVGDMTSMIDVVFLLLIFFILMPFKAPEARIESHLPKDSGQGPGKANEEKVDKIDVNISVDKGVPIDIHSFQGVRVKINGKPIANFVGLKQRLADLKAGLKVGIEKVPVELNADEDVPFYFVMKALDYAKLNGFSFIKFPAAPVLEWGKKPRRNIKK